VKDFEQLWSERFARLDVVLAELKEAERGTTQLTATEYGDGNDGDEQHG